MYPKVRQPPTLLSWYLSLLVLSSESSKMLGNGLNVQYGSCRLCSMVTIVVASASCPVEILIFQCGGHPVKWRLWPYFLIFDVVLEYTKSGAVVPNVTRCFNLLLPAMSAITW